MIAKRILITSSVLLYCFVSFGQDSLKAVRLNNVDIIATSLKEENRQTSGDALKAEQLDKVSFNSAGDAAKFLSGVTVKDYGGIGGLKTVSVRGLGSMHTNVIYDGLSINNAQNGQIDLSKFGTDNINELSLSNGNRIQRMQTAKSLSSANVLVIESRKPYFEKGKNTDGYASLGAGSFKLGTFTAMLNHKFSNKVSTNIYTDIVSSKGEYPYTLHYGFSANDSTSKEKRQNNSFFSAQAEANLFYDINTRSSLRTKAYFYYSDKGLPGPTTLYYQNSKQHLWDKDAFLQSMYKLRINDFFDYKTHVKLSYSHTRYYDPLYNNAQGFQDDRYTQNEAYWNNIISWHKGNKASLTLTNDLIASKLKARNNYSFDPSRFSTLTAIIAAYKYKVLLFDFNILHTYTKDEAGRNQAFSSQNHLSPFFSVGVKTKYFEASVFYKDIFRLPTFNDLYYNAVGEVNLKPEKTKQYNLHMAAQYGFGEISTHDFLLSADLYHNSVTDKIVAVPRNNLFIWSMVNYGKVRIDGLEVKFAWKHGCILFGRDFGISANLTYNHSYAIDNDPNSNSYKNQIQYTPLNSGNAILSLDFDKLNLSYTGTYVGIRYTNNQNSPRNSLPAYCEHSLSLSFAYKHINIKLSCNNFTNSQYEVIKSYPMPGRQWIINFKYKF